MVPTCVVRLVQHRSQLLAVGTLPVRRYHHRSVCWEHTRSEMPGHSRLLFGNLIFALLTAALNTQIAANGARRRIAAITSPLTCLSTRKYSIRGDAMMYGSVCKTSHISTPRELQPASIGAPHCLPSSLRYLSPSRSSSCCRLPTRAQHSVPSQPNTD